VGGEFWCHNENEEDQSVRASEPMRENQRTNQSIFGLFLPQAFPSFSDAREVRKFFKTTDNDFHRNFYDSYALFVITFLPSCLFLQFLSPLGLTLVLAAILVKTSTIYSIFISTFQVRAPRVLAAILV